MKKLILGFVLGVAAVTAFLYLGGSKYLIVAGEKAEEAGRTLQKVEKKLKDGTEEATETVNQATEKIKKLMP